MSSSMRWRNGLNGLSLIRLFPGGGQAGLPSAGSARGCPRHPVRWSPCL